MRLRSRSILVLALVLALLGGGCQSDAEKAAEIVQAATPLMESAPDQAAARLEEATRLDPRSDAAFARLARVRLAQQAFAPAKAAAEQAVAVHDTSDHRELLALAHVGLGEWEPALAELQRALALEPGRAKLLVEVGRVQERLEHPEEAKQAYRDALAADAQPVEARVGLAALLVAEGERTESRTLLEGAQTEAADDEPLRERITLLLSRVDQLDTVEAARETLLAAEREEGAVEGDGDGAPEGDDGAQTGDTVDAEAAIGLGTLDTIGRSGRPGGVGYEWAGGSPAPARPGPPPGVRVANVTVRGSIAQDIGRRVARMHIARVRHCYEQALREAPTAAGSVTVSVTVAGDGSVTSTAPGASTLADARVGACIAAAFRSIAFPAPTDAQSATVDMSFDLSPPPEG